MNKGIGEYVRQELKKAEQALKAAQNLLADKLYDDAVSRSYYAVFHSARGPVSCEDARLDREERIMTANE